MGSGEIAIVLINFNNNIDTVECVDSIQKSIGIQLPFIVVVDNSSRIKNIEEQIQFYPKLKVIYNQENVGFGKANNIGIDWLKKNVKTDFIFILNNDTILKEDTLSLLVNSFPSDPEVVMISPKILTYEKVPKIWYAGGCFNFKKLSVDISSFGNLNKEVESKAVDFASGCAMFFRSSFFEKEEAFDSNIFMYDEDVELCLRLKKKGQKIYFVNNVVLFHKCQGSQNNDHKRKEINQLNSKHPSVRFYLSNTIFNRYYILKKHFNGVDKMKFKLMLTTYWMLKSIHYLLTGNFRLSLFTAAKTMTA